jgi:uncharacterized protein (UPF0548 family)
VYALRRPSVDRLARLRAGQADAALTYGEVGASLLEELPEGYSRARVSAPAGRGNTGMLLARRAIREWAGHEAAGVVLEPELPPIEEGTVLALGAPLFGLWVTAACRIVRVVDTDDVFGFAYGTLPHHPEIGEESFLARRDADGVVHLEVQVFSNPATRLARLGGPVSMRLRDVVLARYLDGLVDSATR